MGRDDRCPAAMGGADSSAIMHAWEKFLAGDESLNNPVRRLVEDSWRRSLERGVSPGGQAAPMAVDGEGLHSLRRRHEELVEAAKPIMAQAKEFLAESGTVMVLTDPVGVILWMEGDMAAKDHGQNIRLMPGAIWDEGAAGTNAIGTALACGQPVQISAAEHFCEGIKRWTCSASVIRDPFDGQVLGVLDISGLSGAHNTHCLALAVAGVGRIEARLARDEMEKRARLLDITLGQARRLGENGLVIFDRRGRLVRANEGAGLFLNSRGVELGSCKDLGIAGLVDGSGSPGQTPPDWLKADWLEPVIDHQERLGTLLAIPLSRQWVAKPATQPVAAKGAPESFAGIIGTSQAMNKARSRAQQLAKLHVPVLLLGPTGAGKEVFARALHKYGPNPSGPFVPLNCGGMTRELLASELFGYVDGAFTGARRGGMEGKFEAADGGTLFLDEIGEMPLELQAHLLRVLEGGEVCRIGETKPRKVRIRLVAATNRDLRAEVAGGTFRMDLYYRLAVTILKLPALGEHKEDIPLLVRHFVEQVARNHGVPEKHPSADLLDAMLGYSWPGNVRELRNVVESMVLLAEGDMLTIDDLPPEIADGCVPIGRAEAGERPLLTVVASQPEAVGRLADSERHAIAAAIRAESGNYTRAAARLGIAKSTLYEKMKRYGIDRSSAS